MDFDLILRGLFTVSLLTTVVTEILKKLVNDKQPTITALIVSTILSIATSTIYILMNSVVVDVKVVCTIVVFIFFSWCVACCGYEKIKEIILQIKEGKTNE